MFLPTQLMDDRDQTLPDERASRTRAAQPAPSASSAGPVAPALAGTAPEAGHTALSSLSPSLLQDLQRFDAGQPQRELLEVLAAALRHTQALAIDMAWGASALTLTVFPQQRRLHCPLPLADWAAHDLGALQVRRVRPALMRAPAVAQTAHVAQVARSLSESQDTGQLDPGDVLPGHDDPGALAPLLWRVALQGSRAALLPELQGPAGYRVVPGLSLVCLDVPGAMASCIARLRRQTCNLAEIAGWTGVGKERATRLLNALYLQSGLIVSRSHPAATTEDWRGYRK